LHVYSEYIAARFERADTPVVGLCRTSYLAAFVSRMSLAPFQRGAVVLNASAICRINANTISKASDCSGSTRLQLTFAYASVDECTQPQLFTVVVLRGGVIEPGCAA
jgi:hypothetical protein